MGTNIHWFPGHMNKALNEIKEKVKLVDIVIELLDTRIPYSSFNDEFEKFVNNKKRLFVFTKEDLADPEITKGWVEQFKKEGKDFIFLDVIHDNVIQILTKRITYLAKEKHEKERSKGMKPQPVRAMIIGIPNVGKSSLINKLAKRKVAGVENRPGFTRGEQMIKINNDFLLVDTPGVLPMNYENKKKAMHLALVGSIKEEILPTLDMANYLLDFFKNNYPSILKERFDIKEINENHAVLEEIARKRGLLGQNGVLQVENAASLLLKEFKDGKLGCISLERAL
ncbi:MAG: ribosome biogenesis GTPase YlqF [Bacilli bacterium]|nr:ribosome biogenesis GTPase YlqF [Bacilli bacterium]